MPRGDGTGPTGKGPGTGRGMGQGGRGGAGRGAGRGRMGGSGLGLGGKCVCPNCGKTVPHRRGVPCNSITCPACGTMMTRTE
jgi:electron transport complex protein RnfB